jgi:poly(hydroxyalkanoate) granule-associated protein
MARSRSGKRAAPGENALKAVREQAGEAQGRWDKLEQVFEDRVSRTLHKLGVVTSSEVTELSRQVDELTRQVRAMTGARRAKAKAAPRAKKKPAAAKKR